MKQTGQRTGTSQPRQSVRFFVPPRSVSRKRSQIVDTSLQHVLYIILVGTFFIFTSLAALLLVSFLFLHNIHVAPRLIIALGGFLYLVLLAILFRRREYRLVAWLLTLFYVAIATLILYTWGIGTPIGVLLLGCIIVLVGSVLGTAYIFPSTISLLVILSVIQVLHSYVFVDPESPFKNSSFGDVFSYGTIFIAFSLITWLSRRRLELALDEVIVAETALKKEKLLLAKRLEQKTRSLKEAQLKEMRQLYHFAELGQLSAAVLHDLSNHLTVLTIDIDDIGQKHNRAAAIDRAKQSVAYLEALTRQTRKHLGSTEEALPFYVQDIITEAVEGLRQKATRAGVALVITDTPKVRPAQVEGDPLRLAQVIGIIISNAIEAYDGIERRRKEVTVHTTHTKDTVTITITDNGIGITPDLRKHIFTPLHTTKKNGLGIGLFIANEIIRTHFKGQLLLDPRTDATSFVITTPVSHKKQ